MNLFDLAAKITLDSSSYESGLKSAESKGVSFGQKIKSGLKTAAIAAGAAIAAAGTAVIAFGKDSVAAGQQFDQSMSQVAATMGKSVDEIQDLRKFAQKMGAETAFSATQAADALNYMALAGYDSKTSMQMLPNVLNLAAAGGIELARASDMVTDAQSALGLSIDQTNAMVDQMAKTASKSNTSVAQLGDAILTIGATARGVKGGTTELNTILGVLADNGIKGAEGGTKLRNMILSLQNPTKDGAEALKKLGVSVYDADGNMRSLIDIIEDLQIGLGDMDQASKDAAVSGLFNKQDVAAVNALLNTSKTRFDELSSSIEDATGAAQQMADTQLDNLAGDITLFQSALEGAKITLSDALTPAIRDFVQFGTKEIGKLDKAFKLGGLEGFADQLGKSLSSAVKKIAKAAPKLLKAASTLAISFIDSFGKTVTKNAPRIIRYGFSIAGDLSKGIIEKIPELMGDVGTLIGESIANLPRLIKFGFNVAVGLAKGIISGIPQLASGVWDGIVGLFSEPISDEVAKSLDKIDDLNDRMEEWREEQNQLKEEMKIVESDYAAYEYWLGVYDELKDKTDLTKTEQELLNKAVETLNGILPETAQIVQDETGEWVGNTNEIYNNIEAMKLRAKAEVYYSKMNDVLSEMVDIEWRIGEEQTKLNDLTNQYDTALKSVNDTGLIDLQSEFDAFLTSVENGEKTVWDASDAMKNYATSVGMTIDPTDQLLGKINILAAADIAMSNLKSAAENLHTEVSDMMKPVDELNAQIEAQKSVIEADQAAWEEMNAKVENYANQAATLNATAKDFQDAGSNTISAFIYGMEDQKDAVIAKASEVANAAVRTIKNQLQIHSPSRKVRKEIGQMFGKGLALGISDEESDVEKAGTHIADTMESTIKGAEFGDFGLEKTSSAIRRSETEPISDRPIYLVLDSGELVGKIVRKMDVALGNENTMKLRFGGATV